MLRLRRMTSTALMQRGRVGLGVAAGMAPTFPRAFLTSHTYSLRWYADNRGSDADDRGNAGAVSFDIPPAPLTNVPTNASAGTPPPVADVRGQELPVPCNAVTIDGTPAAAVYHGGGFSARFRDGWNPRLLELVVKAASTLIRTAVKDVCFAATCALPNTTAHDACNTFTATIAHRSPGCRYSYSGVYKKRGIEQIEELVVVVTAVTLEGELVLIVLLDRSIAAHTAASSGVVLLDPRELDIAGAVSRWAAYAVRNAHDEAVMAAAMDVFVMALTCSWRLGDYLSKLNVIEVTPDSGPSFTLRVASVESHWDTFASRHCEFRLHSDESKRSSVATIRPLFLGAVDFDTDKPHVTQLFGGESGSGKTMAMLAGSSSKVSFVVYICFSVMKTGSAADKLFVQLTQLQQPKKTRNKIFLDMVVLLVKQAIGEPFNDYITNTRGEQREACDVPSVRFAFDEAGQFPDAVNALVAVGATGIRRALGWPPEVKVHAVMGGTGIGSATNPGGSACTRYRLTMLEPSRSLWKEMRKKLEHDLGQTRTKLLASVDVMLNEAENDAVCSAAIENPRLAALVASECVRLARASVSYYTFKRVHPAEFRFRVLLPAAARYKSLNGLETLEDGEGTRRVLVAALRRALPVGEIDLDELDEPVPTSAVCVADNVSLDLLVRTYGVLVDNSRFLQRDRVDLSIMTIMHKRDEENKKIEVVNPAAKDEVACFPKAKGRYSISRAMVAQLYLLLMGNSSSYIVDAGDRFEVAVAQMLYVAVQVYEGRRVVELLRFLFGYAAVTPDIVTSLGEAMVEFGRVELRYNGVRSEDTRKLWREGPVKNGTMWVPGRADGTAWVEVSPARLPSADVVLHIPGVVTLPVKCCGRGCTDASLMREALEGIMVRLGTKDEGQRQLARRLAALSGGTPVVAVVCAAAGALPRCAGQSTSPPRDGDGQLLGADAFGDGVIVVEGYGGEGSGVPWTREWCTRRIVRSMLALNLRLAGSEGVDVVEAAGHSAATDFTAAVVAYHDRTLRDGVRGGRGGLVGGNRGRSRGATC